MKQNYISLVSSSRLLTFGAVAVMGALAATAKAATITWDNQWVTHSGVETELFGPLSTLGALAQAENLGSTTAINIDTGHGTIAFAGDTSAPSFNRLGGAGGPFFNYATVPLLQAADWGGTTAGTLVLSGLTDAQEYLVELIAIDNRGADATKTLSVDGGPSVTFTSSSGGYRLFTGTFTADATSQSIGLLVTKGNPTINAFQLRAIPEPSALLLLGLGTLGLGLRRR